MAAIVYNEVTARGNTIATALRDQIDVSADWEIVPTYWEDTGRTATTANAGGTYFVSSNGSDYFAPGDVLRFSMGEGDQEDVTVSAIASSNQINISTPFVSSQVGVNIYRKKEHVVRQVNGDLVVDLNRINSGGTTSSTAAWRRQPIAVWKSPDGTSVVDKIDGYLFWYGSTSGTLAKSTTPVHAIVSAGPEHLTIITEGPRSGEPDVESYPTKNILHLSPITPYDDADTSRPYLLVINTTENSYVMGTTAFVERDAADVNSWVTAGLLTLAYPVTNSTGTYSTLVRRNTHRRGTTRFAWPFVVLEDDDGPRGRLDFCYFPGHSEEASPGELLTIGGLTYIVVNAMSFQNGMAWTPFGVGSNLQSATRPLLLVPYSGTP